MDFVSQLYNLSSIEAAKMITQDFCLAYELDKPLDHKQRAEIRQRQERRKLVIAWRDGVNVLFRMSYTMRDAISRVSMSDNVGGDVIEILATLTCLIDTLETGQRGKILNVLNGGDPNRWI